MNLEVHWDQPLVVLTSLVLIFNIKVCNFTTECSKLSMLVKVSFAFFQPSSFYFLCFPLEPLGLSCLFFYSGSTFALGSLRWRCFLGWRSSCLSFLWIWWCCLSCLLLPCFEPGSQLLVDIDKTRNISFELITLWLIQSAVDCVGEIPEF